MHDSVIIVIDDTVLCDYLSIQPATSAFEQEWLIMLAIALWDNSQSNGDAGEDLGQWLMRYLPAHHNETLCFMSSYTNANYSVTLLNVVRIIIDVVNDLVELINRHFDRALSGYVYAGGWTITSIHFADGVYIRYDRTYINELQSAADSLLPRLDLIQRNVQGTSRGTLGFRTQRVSGGNRHPLTSQVDNQYPSRFR